jgi:hypothetical protein
MRNNASTSTVPVIVLSGQRGPELAYQLKGLRVNAVFTKPVLFDALREEISKHVSLRERREHLSETALALH